ncbi:MAG: SDR family oxidoreductase [Pseudaminobacter sp.]|nr:SDR family oxidoreductase [Pseudaminobacter sp.]
MFARYPAHAGRPVIVSGGASGIGEAVVRAYAAEGARVGFVDLADGEALAAELNAAGGTVVFRRCDITDTAAYQATIAEFQALHGPALVLLNNAANDTRHDWRDVTPEMFDSRIAVNLRHAFFAIQAVAPGMIAAGGMPAYTASKAATHGMTRSFARDLGKYGIRVNTLVPGWVMTQRQLDLWIDDAANDQIDKNQCLAGRIMPEDIARMALFLGSDDSKMCSGQNFIVDGGWV